MPKHTRSSERGKVGRVKDVRFMEVEFAAPVSTRMVIELEGGLRLLVADDTAVEVAAKFVNFLQSNISAKSAKPPQRKGARP